MASPILKMHSKVRWLEHQGLVELDPDARFAITAAGEVRLTGVSPRARSTWELARASP